MEIWLTYQIQVNISVFKHRSGLVFRWKTQIVDGVLLWITQRREHRGPLWSSFCWWFLSSSSLVQIKALIFISWRNSQFSKSDKRAAARRRRTPPGSLLKLQAVLVDLNWQSGSARSRTAHLSVPFRTRRRRLCGFFQPCWLTLESTSSLNGSCWPTCWASPLSSLYFPSECIISPSHPPSSHCFTWSSRSCITDGSFDSWKLWSRTVSVLSFKRLKKSVAEVKDRKSQSVCFSLHKGGFLSPPSPVWRAAY